MFGRRGFLGMPLGQLGLVFTDSVPGIVVAMAFVGLPFLITAARDAFASVEEEYELAALADGASRWQAFSRVVLPLAWPGVLSGGLMMWARGVSEFGAVVILAYHPKVVPVLCTNDSRFRPVGRTAGGRHPDFQHWLRSPP